MFGRGFLFGKKLTVSGRQIARSHNYAPARQRRVGNVARRQAGAHQPERLNFLGQAAQDARQARFRQRHAAALALALLLLRRQPRFGPLFGGARRLALGRFHLLGPLPVGGSVVGVCALTGGRCIKGVRAHLTSAAKTRENNTRAPFVLVTLLLLLQHLTVFSLHLLPLHQYFWANTQGDTERATFHKIRVFFGLEMQGGKRALLEKDQTITYYE
jgi:hypothetical protein